MQEKLNDLDIIRKLENEIGKKLEILERDQIVNNKGGKYGYTIINDAVIGLKMQQMSVRDIYLLEELKNLKFLNLLGNNISDISPLKNLTKLEKLSLSSNKISDISYLKDLKNLSELFLSSNQITDISPLYSLMGLKRLTNDGRDIWPMGPWQELLDGAYMETIGKKR